jgi:hypothetical protein
MQMHLLLDRLLLMAGNTTTSSTTTGTAMTATNSSPATPTMMIEQPKKIIVPWNEINSALGQVVFLLYILQYNTTPNSCRINLHVMYYNHVEARVRLVC